MAVATSRLLQPAAQGNVISFNEACSDVHMLHIYNPVETITVNVEVAIHPTSTAAFADVSEVGTCKRFLDCHSTTIEIRTRSSA
jgi:hypothetical protein